MSEKKTITVQSVKTDAVGEQESLTELVSPAVSWARHFNNNPIT